MLCGPGQRLREVAQAASLAEASCTAYATSQVSSLAGELSPRRPCAQAPKRAARPRPAVPHLDAGSPCTSQKGNWSSARQVRLRC